MSVAELFDPTFDVKLLSQLVSGDRTYYILSLQDSETGSLALAYQDLTGPARLIKQGVTLTPLPNWVPEAARDQILNLLANRFLAEYPLQDKDALSSISGLPDRLKSVIGANIELAASQRTGTLNDEVYTSALACNGKLITKNVAGTENGVLACAWALNEVVRRATGRTISKDLFDTDSVYDALKAGKGIAVADGNEVAGTIVISPEANVAGKDVHGHAGIVGEGGRIYSNSSSRGMWMQNYTVDAWKAYFLTHLRLQVLFFNLNPSDFTVSNKPSTPLSSALLSASGSADDSDLPVATTLDADLEGDSDLLNETYALPLSTTFDALLPTTVPGTNIVIDLWGGDSPLADFNQVKKAGILGVIHKATDPLHGSDSYYHKHRLAAKAAGLLWGCYHFGRLGDGVMQADTLLSFANPQSGELVVLDFELDAKHPKTVMQLGEAEAFVEHIRSKLGRYPTLYGGDYLREHQPAKGSPLLSCPLWFADYRVRNGKPEIPTHYAKWVLWQWTADSTSVPGMKSCDRSTFNGTRDQLIAFWSGA